MADNERYEVGLAAATRGREVALGELMDVLESFAAGATPEEVRVMTSVLNDWETLNTGPGHEIALFAAMQLALSGAADRLVCVPADRLEDVLSFLAWGGGDDAMTATA